MSKSKLSDFQILEEIGRGSYGIVFKVRRRTDNRFYVIKQINISAMNERDKQDSLNEVKILASLTSPHIIKYYDSFLDEGKLNIVMELAEHGSLHDLIRKTKGKKLPENMIWSFAIQMSLALYCMHSKRILHRDIKSMNVFLDSHDRVKIGDFGIAKVLHNTSHMAQTMVGTPYYLSPELCENKPYNAKSDVWALGCVLYELATLKHPFDAANQGALILKIIRGKFPPISPTYSADLRELIDACLSRVVTRRPSSEDILRKPVIIAKARALGIEGYPPELLSGRPTAASSAQVAMPTSIPIAPSAPLPSAAAPLVVGNAAAAIPHAPSHAKKAVAPALPVQPQPQPQPQSQPQPSHVRVISAPKDGAVQNPPSYPLPANHRPLSAHRLQPALGNQPRVRARPGMEKLAAAKPQPIVGAPLARKVVASSSNQPTPAFVAPSAVAPVQSHVAVPAVPSLANGQPRQRVSIRDLQREEEHARDIADVRALPSLRSAKPDSEQEVAPQEPQSARGRLERSPPNTVELRPNVPVDLVAEPSHASDDEVFDAPSDDEHEVDNFVAGDEAHHDDDAEVYDAPDVDAYGAPHDHADSAVTWNVVAHDNANNSPGSSAPGSTAVAEKRRSRQINALLDRTAELQQALDASMLECTQRIGVAKTKEILDFLRQFADSNADQSPSNVSFISEEEEEALMKKEEERAAEVHRFVFGRISFADADLITKLYHILYCENELSETEQQVGQLVAAMSQASVS